MPLVMFVDGSLTSSGIAIGEVTFKELPTILHIERLKTSDKNPLELRLKTIYERITALLKEYKVEQLIMEDKFVGKNSKIAIKIGQADGIIKLAGAMFGIKVGLLAPSTIKIAITNFAHATKEDVMIAVNVKFCDQPIVPKHIKPGSIGKKGVSKQDDMADAVAGLYTYAMEPEKVQVA